MADNALQEVEKKKLNMKEIGRSGTLITASQIEDDYLPELIGVDGQIKYAKMLKSDSQIRKPYHAVSNPIKSATWSIQPASDDKKDLEVAALIEQVLFKDLPDGFTAKLDEILTFPWHGHAVFEKIFKNRVNKSIGQYTGLENLAFRDQRTLDKWNFSNAGILESIHQEQSGDVPISVDIPAENLIIFYNERKGDDNGYAFCRMLYGNYKRKLLYKQLQAIGIEKGAIGVPVLTLPENVEITSEEYQAAVDALTNYTQAESAHIILPANYDLKLDQSNTFDPAKVQVAIKSENEEISGSILAMWLEMGIGGNSAVGSSTGISAESFKDGIEYIANKIADQFNLNLIPDLVFANYGDTVDVLPTLVHSGIADEAGEELMKVVTGYTKAQIITPDEQLEDHIRKVHNLPKKAEGEQVENQESNDGGGDDDSPTPDDKKEEEIEEEVELNTKAKIKNPKDLINQQAPKISETLREAMQFSSAKYINDVMNRYKQLSDSRKQNATSKVKMGGTNNLRKALKKDFTDTAFKSIEMARSEVPTKSDVELNTKNSREMGRMAEKFGDISEIRLNEFSKMPAHMQVLIAKQADLISDATLTELRERIDFSFSGIEVKSADDNVIKQNMEEAAETFIVSSQIDTKGTNSASLMVNEGRDTFFFEPDVLEEIHSFTFMNFAPKSKICTELAGTTFNTNDAESLRYTPPLHHNCKSFLRANLKTSKGVENLNVSSLSPTADAKKIITL